MSLKFKPFILSTTLFFAWGCGQGIAMETGPDTGLSGSQASHNVFDQQVSRIREYINSLSVAPNLVFGVSSSEQGIERFDKSWIFVDVSSQEGNNPRDLTLDFNAIRDMQALAKAFPNTFQTIAFDAEVPTYIKGFEPAHLKAIHATLKMGGEFYLPWQYAMGADNQNPNQWADKSPDQALTEFVKENNLENRPGMFGPIVHLPSILGRGQDDELNKKIVEEIRDKNYLRVMQGIFGKENVEILPARKLPFPENEGRLTNPPYVDVFLSKKTFPTEDIPEPIVPEKSDQLTTSFEKGDVEKGEDHEIVPAKPLANQIQELKEKLKDILVPSLVVIVDEKEQPTRFGKNWVKITRPYNHSQDPLVLQTELTLSEIKEISESFPNTFEKIVFDVETPSLEMRGWTKEHFQYLYQALKPGGTFTVPIHYDWHIDQNKTYPTLEKARKDLIKKIPLDTDRFVFEGFGAPYTFQSAEGKNKEAEDIFTRLKTFALSGNNTERVDYKKIKLSEWVINRIRESFRIIKSEATLTEDLISIINQNLYGFTYGTSQESMKNAIEQHLLEPERIKFIKKFTSRYLIPHTVAFFEDIFGKGHVGVAFDKKLPFDVVKERQHMDYVVFECHKEL